MEWRFDLLCTPLGGTTEGPVWNGEVLRFTHIPKSLVLQYDPRTGQISSWRDGVNRVNGLAYDMKGDLFGCCSGGRSLVRLDPNGRNVVLADQVSGKRLNTPNDLAIDHAGRIWFTNPWNSGNVDPDEVRELGDFSVLRADPQGDGTYSVTRVTVDTTMPNGVLLSADQNTLYVAESSFEKTLNRELRAYPIRKDGSLGPFKLLHTFGADDGGVHRGIDGMCLDCDGNIVACAGWSRAGPGAAIYVFAPTGRVIETHRIPARQPTNCCFGGADLGSLFVTSTDGHLFVAHTGRRGWCLYP